MSEKINMNGNAASSGMTNANVQSLPEKPPGSLWTDEQWEAIAARGSNVLVAAAAGSGKTAVLIERLIRIITSDTDPVDVDRLLVATFTKAAADEMRHRMRAALEKKIAEQPDSARLRRQLALIHRASITTLHSFCMDVVSRHYQKIELDPAFRIANEIEAELLRQDVMETLFEERYQTSAPEDPFWGLLDRYGGARSDDAVHALVARLYDFSRSHPFPERWLRESAQTFAEFALADDHPIVVQLLRDARFEAESACRMLQDALDCARKPGGPDAYADTLADELAMTERLLAALDAGSLEKAHEAFEAIRFGRLKAVRGGDADKTLQEQAKSLRDGAKKQLQELRARIFSRPPQQLAEEMRSLAPYMRALTELTIEFGERFMQAKRAKRLVDFSDLEHYTLAILCAGTGEDGTLLPSEAAREYQQHFAEVLLDEYQDTNQVQEAIVSLLSRPGRGNRFMVGDVKQSIYRFRLADPGIFLDKYKHYRAGQGGRAIDLARNFRSRSEVVHGTNYIFKQIMEQRSAEIDYDDQAELVYGAAYPDRPNEQDAATVDVWLIHRQQEQDAAEGDAFGSTGAGIADGMDAGGESAALEEQYELETAELEARMTAMHIRDMMGLTGKPPFQVTDDRSAGKFRNVAYRDIVILLRASQAAAPIYVEQLRAAGIPAYAELSSGYFEAVEVDVMISLLKVIDNPLQDIPLAGVLRSPIVGLNAEQLAQVRLADRSGSYYDAVLRYVEMQEGKEGSMDEAAAKLSVFLEQLGTWREEARSGLLSDLIWRLYRETGYYDYVGGLAGGAQRQANLKALYDRCRQFETTSLRGLFRFLRFIERLRESGGDLGAAKALSEQEDVVRIMSIHKSKGLEFPVVFVAGMAKTFNLRDLSGDFLLHKELGIGPLIVDPAMQASYPSAAWLALRSRLRMEMLAEEMRILYVALTRAKEKLILLGTTRNIEQQLNRWAAALDVRSVLLPAHQVAAAKSYLDWVGPAVLRHPSLAELRSAWKLGDSRIPAQFARQARFRLQIISQDRLSAWQEAAAARSAANPDFLQQVAAGEPVNLQAAGKLLIPPSARESSDALRKEIEARLEWTYPYERASAIHSKTSVTEIKRLRETALLAGSDEHPPDSAQLTAPPPVFRRPAFMGEKRLTAAELGTVYHAVMQQLPLDGPVTEETVQETLSRMALLEILREDERQAVDPGRIVSFFRTPIGRRLLSARHVRRELPFSYGLPAGELHPDAGPSAAGETVLVQGVIDCLFEEEDGLVLLDYKTDVVRGKPEHAAQRYRLQLELYARAISAIERKPVKERALYFFDGGHCIVLR